jgi:ankyrin repeat protein
MIPLLIEYGATIDLQNDIGNTALHQAAKWHRAGALLALLEHGASLDLKNSRGQTVLGVATDDRIIEILREAGAEE